MSKTDSTASQLFMQLLVFTDCSDLRPLLMPLERLPLDIVLYKNLNDPQGVGLLAVTDDPELLVTDLRDLLDSRVFRVLMLRQELTMVGHVAPSNGEGEDHAAVVRSDAWPWAAWFPLRATAKFAGLSEAEQQLAWRSIESACGANGEQLAHLRLKSHALDRGGNDFVHGLHAHDLHTLSRCIDAMRRAPLYSKHIAAAGPFFVGRALRSGDTYVGPQARW